MKEKILYPSKASHRIGDLLSKDLSNETKANTARWYAEMLIKEFLKDQFEDETYKKESLSYLISKLKGKIDKGIIDSLSLIKNFGDKASHYNPDVAITDSESQKAVDAAIRLYQFIIIDELKKRDFYYHRDRTTLISVLLPSMRVEIYSELLDFTSKNLDPILIWKWCLACLKNNNINKAKRKLTQLRKNKILNEHNFNVLSNDLNVMNKARINDELPIPFTRADFCRNLNDLLGKHLDDESKNVNSRLISILSSMADGIEPSSMKHYEGMRIF